MKNSIVFLIIFTSVIYSQNWQKIDSVFAPNGIGVSSFSSPFIFDYDEDGFKDIFLGSTDNRVKFYRNKSGNTLPPSYTANEALLEQIYANGYQFTNSYYPILADLDNDFINELIIGGYNGFLLYKNSGSYSQPNWIKIDSVFATVNTLIGTDAKPALVDIDGDGDLDLFAGIGESLFGGPTSGIIIGFRNIGTISSPMFSQDNSLTTGLPDAGYNCYPTFADMDNDGDFDLLIGRDLASLLYYRNTGTKNTPVWTAANNVFAIVETSTYWKNPCLSDLDNDGDFDLLYGTADGNLFYYQNVGSPSSPSFLLKSDYFRIIKNNGNGATVSIADFDNDGDNDFISGSWTGKINYFKNTGTNKSPQFSPSTSSFTGLTVGSYSAPIFVDLDNDSDFDIVSGALNGKLSYYVNSNNTFQANTSVFSNISVSGFSHPAFCDLDNDNDQDMLLGSEVTGETSFYLNNQGVFTLDNSFIRDIQFPANTRPVFSDIDNDGDFDCIFGKSNGSIVMYENIGTPNEPRWQLNTEIFDGIKVKQNAAPCFADFDNDSKKDLIIAEYDGNFTFYKNLFALTSVNNNLGNIIPVSFSYGNYPNPFNPETTIEFSLPYNANISINIYNSLGQFITNLVTNDYSAGIYKVHFNSSLFNISSGIYFYTIKVNNFNNEKIYSGKMVLIK
jgi:hypothetical protein